MRIFKIFFFLLCIVFIACSGVSAVTNSSDVIAGYYVTKIGCIHCAKTDAAIFNEWLIKYPYLAIIEYEISQHPENAYILTEFDNMYHTGYNIPQLNLSGNLVFVGDSQITNQVPSVLSDYENGTGSLVQAANWLSVIGIASLRGYPKIWYQDRILIRQGLGGNSDILRDLLTTSNITASLSHLPFQEIQPISIALSGQDVEFNHAVTIDGWIFQWNNGSVPISPTITTVAPTPTVSPTPNGNQCNNQPGLTLMKIIQLAASDAINPCPLAVLMALLIGIVTRHPDQKRNVLLAGLAFIISIFLCYLIIGVIIIALMKSFSILPSEQPLFYKLFGCVALLLGILKIKDFIWYHPGGILREMPIIFRPVVKKLIEGVGSTIGAFIIGIFVTIFLLPCKLGPYVIGCGILTPFDAFAALPYLVLYNCIFVLPMLVVTLIVYLGYKKIEALSGWRTQNVKYLHLVAGLIISSLGIIMIFGFF